MINHGPNTDGIININDVIVVVEEAPVYQTVPTNIKLEDFLDK